MQNEWPDIFHFPFCISHFPFLTFGRGFAAIGQSA